LEAFAVETKQQVPNLKQVAAISARELAAKLSLSPRTVWRLLSAKKLPKPVSIGGSKRFLIKDVNLFLECNCDMAAYKAKKEAEQC
jgi:predicted DNA-binding transcriptional regulator AlpA